MFIVFGTRSLLDKSPQASLCIGKSETQKSGCINILDAHLNDILSFKNHVRSKARTTNYIFHLICNISKFITMEVTQILICTLIFSNLDHANSRLGHVSQNHSKTSVAGSKFSGHTGVSQRKIPPCLYTTQGIILASYPAKMYLQTFDHSMENFTWSRTTVPT